MIEKSINMGKKEQHRGSVNLNSNDLPEILDWTIGEEYEITLKVKMTSISEIDSYDIEHYSNVKKGDVNARFDIKGVNSPKKEKNKNIKGKIIAPVKIKFN